MHHCLRINEILREITEVLCADPNTEEALPAAARLARCCKGMEAPVLEVLWGRCQTSFIALVKCLPSHLLKFEDISGQPDSKKALIFCGQPAPDNWVRFILYSKRMKTLELPSHSNCVLTVASWQTISLCRPIQVLLPHLETLRWSTRPELLPYIRLFVHPGLSTAAIVVSVITPIPLDATSISSLRVCRYLEHLSIEMPGGTLAHVTLQLSESLPELPRLRSFTTSASLPDNIVRGLSQLCKLERLRCRKLELSKNVPTISPMFPSLRELSGTWHDLDDCTSFLEQVDSQILRGLFVTLQSVLEKSQLPRFLIVASDKGFSKSVTVLEIHLKFYAVHTTSFKLTQEVTELLITFCNLTELRIHGICRSDVCGFALDDESMECLAQALPHIRCLSLGSASRSTCGTPACRVSLNGLKSFAVHCPELLELATHVNALAVPTGIMQGFNQNSGPRCRLQNIRVGDSCVTGLATDQAAIALILLQLFPFLVNIYFSREGSGWMYIEANLKVFHRLDALEG